jgi:hypothetical protein
MTGGCDGPCSLRSARLPRFVLNIALPRPSCGSEVALEVGCDRVTVLYGPVADTAGPFELAEVRPLLELLAGDGRGGRSPMLVSAEGRKCKHEQRVDEEVEQQKLQSSSCIPWDAVRRKKLRYQGLR